MYRLIYSPKAEKSLKKIPQNYQRIILKKTPVLKENPKPRGFDKIAAKSPPLYRIRIGNYRVFYFIDEEDKTVIIVDIVRRTSQTYN